MTYNVNYGLAGDRASLDAIARADADVVFLQETTSAWEIAIRGRLTDTYPQMGFRHCCTAGGLAVLSKTPFHTGKYIASEGEGWFPAWIVVVETALGDVQVLNVHLRPPLSSSGSVVSGYVSTPAIRRAEIARFYGHLDRGLPTLVVGDFNESDDLAIAYLAERGLTSALPRFAGPQATWRWDTSIGRLSSQLDHIVHGPRLAPLEVRVIPAGRSDHLPVYGLFERASAPVAPRRGAAVGTSVSRLDLSNP